MEKFQKKKFVAFAGIGNPSNFFDLLKENNIDIKKKISFPDHHNFSESDYSKLIAEGHDASLQLQKKIILE